jgi:signal transduction histidine kinase
VDVDVTRTARAVQIRVTDTGQGIPSDFLPYVFDRFRQADPSATRGAWGLGIGLSIAKHIVELHGGTIQVDSGGPGQGATFIVQLPASRPAPIDADAGQMPGASVVHTIGSGPPSARTAPTASL